jgi:protein TonB
MKRKLILTMLAMLLVTISSTAQPSKSKRHDRIDYVKESHLLRKDTMLTVLEIDFEWPTILSDASPTALQKSLCKYFFGKGYKDLDTGLASYLNNLGKEITQMPDEAGLRKKYIGLGLRILALEKDKYISLQISSSSRNDNQETPLFTQSLFTYNIKTDKVLWVEDIIKWRELNQLEPGFNLVQQIMRYSPRNNQDVFGLQYDNGGGAYLSSYRPQSIDDLIEMKALPNEACLMPTGVLFDIPGTQNGDGVYSYSLIPTKEIYSHMTQPARRALLGKKKRWKNTSKPTGLLLDVDKTADSMSVYDYASTMPEYNGSKRDMMAYIYGQLEYPSYEKLLGIQGKVVVSVVVERDGTLSSPSVISPVSPGIDRQAVMAVMAMPRWKPGMNNGVPVRVRTYIPVTFELKKEKEARN